MSNSLKMAAFHGSPFSTIQISLNYFSSDTYSICCRLHGLIRACISSSHYFNIAALLKVPSKFDCRRITLKFILYRCLEFLSETFYLFLLTC